MYQITIKKNVIWFVLFLKRSIIYRTCFSLKTKSSLNIGYYQLFCELYHQCYFRNLQLNLNILHFILFSDSLSFVFVFIRILQLTTIWKLFKRYFFSCQTFVIILNVDYDSTYNKLFITIVQRVENCKVCIRK